MRSLKTFNLLLEIALMGEMNTIQHYTSKLLCHNFILFLVRLYLNVKCTYFLSFAYIAIYSFV